MLVALPISTIAKFNIVVTKKVTNSNYYCFRVGIEWTGVFCCLYNLCGMLNTEQEVDVFQTVKQVRRTRPQFIQDQVSVWHRAQKKTDVYALFVPCSEVIFLNTIFSNYPITMTRLCAIHEKKAVMCIQIENYHVYLCHLTLQIIQVDIYHSSSKPPCQE